MGTCLREGHVVRGSLECEGERPCSWGGERLCTSGAYVKMSTSSNTSKKTEAPPAASSSANSDTLLLSVVQRYFKLAAQTVFVWAFGYFEFSPSWLLLGLVVYVWKERNTKAKKNQVAIAQAIARGEKDVILSHVRDLPSWVSIHVSPHAINEDRLTILCVWYLVLGLFDFVPDAQCTRLCRASKVLNGLWRQTDR